MLRLIVSCFLIGVAYCTLPAFKPCKLGELKCEDENAAALYQFVAGALDPLHLEAIEGKLGTLSIKLADIIVKGLKSGAFKNSTFSNVTNWKFDTIFPQLSINGNYTGKGNIFMAPFESSGVFSLDIKDYCIHVDVLCNKSLGPDGKWFHSILDFKLDQDLRGPIKFNATNLSDTAKEFINSRLDDAILQSKLPIIKTIMEQIINIIKGVMAKIPIEKYLILDAI